MRGRYWKKLEEIIIPEMPIFWDRWVLVGPILLLFAAASILIKVSAFHGVTLLFAAIVHLVILRSHRVFSKSCLLFFILFSFVCLQAQAREFFLYNATWVSSLLLSSLLSYHLHHQVREKQKESGIQNEGLAKEAELWQTRFHTIKEKIQEDRAVLEEEIELAHAEKAKAFEDLNALKKLASVTHHRAEVLEVEKGDLELVQQKLQEKAKQEEILYAEMEEWKKRSLQFEMDLEEARRELQTKGEKTSQIDTSELERLQAELQGKYKQEEALYLEVDEWKERAIQLERDLEEARKELQLKKEVVEQRQMRNQTLLAKKPTQSISLKDLAKKSKV